MKINKNKKGVSTIVITVILVALVLAAVAIVWAVVVRLIGKGAGEAEIAGKCLTVDITATTVTCAGTPAVCNVTLSRTGTGDDEIGGVKLVFRNSTAGTSSSAIDVARNIEKLVGWTASNVATTLEDNPNKVEVTVYFMDTAGKERLCQTTNPFEF